MRYLLILLSTLICLVVNAQEDRKDVNKGNKHYKKADYIEAMKAYNEGLEKNPDSYKATYNLANSLYKIDSYGKADTMYMGLEKMTENKDELANIYYNKGNSLLKQEKYEESIEAYKKSLRIRPDDMDAKSNLAYAQAKLPKPQENPDNNGGGGGGGNDNQDQNQNQDNQNQDGQGDQNDQNQDGNNDQNNQNQQGQNDNNQNNQDNQDQNNNQNNQNQNQENDGQNGNNPGQNGTDKNSQNPQQGKISSQQANQILDAVRSNEQRTQEKVQKAKEQKVKRSQSEKNW